MASSRANRVPECRRRTLPACDLTARTCCIRVRLLRRLLRRCRRRKVLDALQRQLAGVRHLLAGVLQVLPQRRQTLLRANRAQRLARLVPHPAGQWSGGMVSGTGECCMSEGV